MILKLLIPCLSATILICSLCYAGEQTTSLINDKKHHTKDGFRNIHPYKEKGFFDFIKWRFSRERPDPGSYDFPLAENDPAFLKSNREKISATWIGHATLLMQIEGLNILTDPNFSKRASPVQWAGPQRIVGPGLSIGSLPPIDIVVISHDHYDSLDKKTLLELYRRKSGDKTKFFVPLRLKNWFKKIGVTNVVELDWWDQYNEKGLDIIAVPVQHWSKRTPFSRNKTLWAGWVIRSKSFSFLFMGDSGYTPHFKEIGEKLGPFDLAAIPIGAYEPRWFMKSHHLDPEEALQAHIDLKSKKSLAIHWGTFILTDEPLNEPAERLIKGREEAGIKEDEFLLLKHGETIVLD